MCLVTVPGQTVTVSTFRTLHEPLEARRVVLGRSTHVDRILPHRTHRMIGAWCFLDHFGPDDVTSDGGMWVPPHPHAYLQTVTWLFEGQGLHTDSLGNRQLIRPGQLNVMTAGPGICHAEVTPEGAPDVLHGVQLWVALPDTVRNTVPPDFAHLADLPRRTGGGAEVTTFIGRLGGAVSPAPRFSLLVGAEIRLAPGAELALPLRTDFEHGLLIAAGNARVNGADGTPRAVTYLEPGTDHLTLANPDPEAPAVLLLIGGQPFEEEIVMWWNFVARSHEEIVELATRWNESDVPARFGQVEGFDGPRLLAPPLPTVRLKSRGRRA